MKDFRKYVFFSRTLIAAQILVFKIISNKYFEYILGVVLKVDIRVF